MYRNCGAVPLVVQGQEVTDGKAGLVLAAGLSWPESGRLAPARGGNVSLRRLETSILEACHE